jgi:hypothetical protein
MEIGLNGASIYIGKHGILGILEYFDGKGGL